MQVTVKAGKREGVVEIHFSEKPSDEVRAELKAVGFRYTSRDNCWWGLKSTLPEFYSHITPALPPSEDHLPDAKKMVAPAEPQPVATPVQEPESASQPEPATEDEAQETVPVLTPAQRFDPEHPGYVLMSFDGENRTVKAEAVSSSGLALVRPTRKREWAIIHLSSGRALGKAFDTVSDRDLAQALFDLAQALADWNLPMESLVTNSDLRQRLKELPARAKSILEMKAAAETSPVPEPTPEPEPEPEPPLPAPVTHVVQANFNKPLTLREQAERIRAKLAARGVQTA